MGVEHARVSRRVAARRATDGRLVDVDDLVELLRPVDAVMLSGAQLGAAVQPRRHALVQDLVDERGLAGQVLLETKSVTTFALLFGTTWVVNAIVFAGVLLAVLLAVETTRRFRTPTLPVLYSGIAAALALAYVVPNASLLGLPVLPRLAAAVALAFTPIFLANLAFAKRFAGTDDAPSAFGINIVGAMFGGCLEYLALIVGFRNLLIVAALLYLAAFALLPRRVARTA